MPILWYSMSRTYHTIFVDVPTKTSTNNRHPSLSSDPIYTVDKCMCIYIYVNIMYILNIYIYIVYIYIMCIYIHTYTPWLLDQCPTSLYIYIIIVGFGRLVDHQIHFVVSSMPLDTTLCTVYIYIYTYINIYTHKQKHKFSISQVSSITQHTKKHTLYIMMDPD